MPEPILRLSRMIDAVNARLGRAVSWLVVAAIVVSAGNAVIRKLFDHSSNAWLELQWWLFGLVFLLAAPWALQTDEHIRIDVVSGRWSEQWRRRIDILGHGLFLLPMALLVLATSWAFFLVSYGQNEQSANAGGLPQWPAKFLIPLGFALLAAQGVSELIKRLAGVNEPRAPESPHTSVDSKG